jgi:plasmid stabilization system protein ParE
LTQHFVWFAEEASIEIARSFRESAEKSFHDLAESPRMGPLKVHEGKFAGVRMWRVTGFESFLIFYRPLKDGVAIERVIHAKQDYQRVLM